MTNDLVEETFNRWRSLLTETRPTDRQKSVEAVKQLYLLNRLPDPYILHCRNPFEMAVLPLLLAAVLSSRQWNILTEAMRDKRAAGNWQARWDQLWSRFLTEFLTPLLRQLIRPLDADRLVAGVQPLLDEVKAQLELHLRSPVPQLQHIEEGPRPVVFKKLSTELSLTWLETDLRNMGKTWQILYDHADRSGLLNEGRRTNIGRFDWRELQIIGQLRLAESQQAFSLRIDADQFVIPDQPALLELVVRLSRKRITWLPAALNALRRTPFEATVQILDWSELDQVRIHVLGTDLFEDVASNDTASSWVKLMQACCGVQFTELLCCVCDNPPTMSTNEHGELHNANGPAVAFAGGFEVYAWNGTAVPPDIIQQPGEIDVDRINTERNVEVRRAMIEIYGLGRFITDSGAEAVHQDECGILYRQQAAREPIVIVKVINSSPEPDGTYRHYFLRVPPDMQRAKQAIAWTFGIPEEDYGPEAET